MTFSGIKKLSICTSLYDSYNDRGLLSDVWVTCEIPEMDNKTIFNFFLLMLNQYRLGVTALMTKLILSFQRYDIQKALTLKLQCHFLQILGNKFEILMWHYNPLKLIINTITIHANVTEQISAFKIVLQ